MALFKSRNTTFPDDIEITLEILNESHNPDLVAQQCFNGRCENACPSTVIVLWCKAHGDAGYIVCSVQCASELALSLIR